MRRIHVIVILSALLLCTVSSIRSESMYSNITNMLHIKIMSDGSVLTNYTVWLFDINWFNLTISESTLLDYMLKAAVGIIVYDNKTYTLISFYMTNYSSILEKRSQNIMDELVNLIEELNNYTLDTYYVIDNYVIFRYNISMNIKSFKQRVLKGLKMLSFGKILTDTYLSRVNASLYYLGILGLGYEGLTNNFAIVGAFKGIEYGYYHDSVHNVFSLNDYYNITGISVSSDEFGLIMVSLPSNASIHDIRPEETYEITNNTIRFTLKPGASISNIEIEFIYTFGKPPTEQFPLEPILIPIGLLAITSGIVYKRKRKRT